MEFVEQYTPESKFFTVLFMDKTRFKQGIIEALVTIIAETNYLFALKQHPVMIAKFIRLTNSFLHENSQQLNEKFTSHINKSKSRLHDEFGS